MRFFSAIWLAWLLITPVLAGDEGLAGYPANMYDPYCATACVRSLSSLTLNCSNGGVTLGMVTFSTSTECYASDTPYLTSLAWCAHTKCATYDVSASKMEYFWDRQATGQKAAGVYAVPAKWTYAEALQHVTEPPTLQLLPTDTALNSTALVPESVYQAQYNVLYSVQRESTQENTYGIVMLVTGFGTPVILTWLGYLPFISNLLHKVRPYLVWPSTIGTYHVHPLPYLLGNAPTVGQALYVVMFVILNIILTAVGYESRQPSAWYANTQREITSYIFYRTGVFAYILTPLVFIFAGRNNILLWMTNWSHSTYLLLHRWVARVYALQAILHSIIGLYLYVQSGMYDMEHNKPYWIWGIVATVCVVALLVFSGLYVRRSYYETFLILHIILAVIVIVACWYHAYDLYKFLGAYQTWLYACSAVWAFDRFARVARILHAGPRYAKMSELGDEQGFVRVDFPGLRWSLEPGRHAYFYFPTLTPLRPWENHPFSVLPTALLHPSFYRGKASHLAVEDGRSENQSSTDQAESNSDMEKHKATAPRVKAVQESPIVGVTIFIRKGAGLTRALRAHNEILTLVEGPYPNNSTSQVLRCDRLLLIGGGIGITALAPFVASHWNVRLCWSMKESARCLVDEMNVVLSEVTDKEVSIGKRLDIGKLLAEEADVGWGKVGVVVSGPGSLCDDARAAVAAVAKRSKRTVFELEVEAYSW